MVLPTPLIKICGLTSSDAVEAAVSLRADFLGFVFHPASPRHLTPEQAKHLTIGLSPSVQTVAVLVNPTDTVLEALLVEFHPHYLQLHGSETPERIHSIKIRFGLPVIKALPVATVVDINAAESYYDVADILLFDTKSADPAMPGGTGRSFDWTLLAGRTFPLPWLLSGGISAENVKEALRISGALGVDVSSSLESAPGIKDPAKIVAFMERVREAL